MIVRHDDLIHADRHGAVVVDGVEDFAELVAAGGADLDAGVAGVGEDAKLDQHERCVGHLFEGQPDHR